MRQFIFCIVILTSSLSGSFAQEYAPEMVAVEGGTFSMGRYGSAYKDELPVHQVTLNSFSISKYEITIEEYNRFCVAVGYKSPAGDDKFPAYGISWQEAVMFCNWLSRVSGLEPAYQINRDAKKFIVKFNQQANGYRLPTEAEWEYAARGGTQTKHYAYSGSNDANEISWNINSGNKLHKVGAKKPNELELYDMSGNCMEWCWDIYDADYYLKSPKENPAGPENGAVRVCRGGNYKSTAETVRVTRRIGYEPDYKDEAMGFRIVKNE